MVLVKLVLLGIANYRLTLRAICYCFLLFESYSNL